MTTTKTGEGQVISVTVGTAGATAGDIVEIAAGYYGVALADIAASSAGPVCVDGVFTVSKGTGAGSMAQGSAPTYSAGDVVTTGTTMANCRVETTAASGASTISLIFSKA
jgi:predicted RecA/RadA family phage recombinase